MTAVYITCGCLILLLIAALAVALADPIWGRAEEAESGRGYRRGSESRQS